MKVGTLSTILRRSIDGIINNKKTSLLVYLALQWSPGNCIPNLPGKIIELTRIFDYPFALNRLMLFCQ